MKGYSEEVERKANGAVTHTVEQSRPEDVTELSPEFSTEVTVNLGNFQFVKLRSTRRGQDAEEVSKVLYEDLSALHKEFRRRHKEFIG